MCGAADGVARYHVKSKLSGAVWMFEEHSDALDWVLELGAGGIVAELIDTQCPLLKGGAV